MKRFIVCVIATIVLAACSGADRSSSNQPAAKQRLAFITNNAADFWTMAQKGCEQADRELNNIDVEFRIPSDGTAAEQRRIVDDLLTKGVAGIAISPVDPANQIQIINEAAERTLLLTQDSDAPSSNRLCYIGTDNRAAGRQAGELIKEVLPKGGKIMLFVGKLDAQNAQERYRGIKDTIDGSNVQIIDVKTDDTDQVRAKANVADTIVKYPDIAALIGLWGYNGPAILNALKEAGKVGQIKVVCFDEDDQTLAGIKEGAIYGTVVQQPYEFGYQAIHLLNRILAGDRSGIPANKQKFIPTLIVKKDNVDEFIAKTNKLRGRS